MSVDIDDLNAEAKVGWAGEVVVVVAPAVVPGDVVVVEEFGVDGAVGVGAEVVVRADGPASLPQAASKAASVRAVAAVRRCMSDLP